MIFPAEEYDVGASLHVSSMPASQHIQHAFNGERERRNLSILKFKISINFVRILRVRPCIYSEVVEVSLNGSL
jgi:hypothetical protein